jgi:hypothetical protein
MTRAKAGRDEDRDGPVEDTEGLRKVLRGLFESEAEFPIKVEGTSTLPYASTVQSLALEEGAFVLKLVRHLPHELLAGALFRMTFAVEDQRFEALITYQAREAYLQYRFGLPSALVRADRRQHTRYPFRPRENAYVIMQDGGIPGVGVAGPLVNIGMGGLAMRVDRVLKLDDGMRLIPGTALFERGKPFPRVRIQDLPRLHLLETRCVTAHAWERGSEIILGLAFLDLSEEDRAALGQSLELRERMYRGGHPMAEGGPQALRSPEGASPTVGGAPGELPAEDSPVEPPAAKAGVLQFLRRRSARVLVAMAPGAGREAMLDRLRALGFHRLEVGDTLDALKALAGADPRRAAPGLILADLALAHTGDSEPLAAVRIIEGELASLGPIPKAILCDSVDPTLLLARAELTRFLAHAPGGEEAWVGILDQLLEA